jgi:hypothetical protein
VWASLPLEAERRIGVGATKRHHSSTDDGLLGGSSTQWVCKFFSHFSPDNARDGVVSTWNAYTVNSPNMKGQMGDGGPVIYSICADPC